MKKNIKTVVLAVAILMPALLTAQIKINPVVGYDFQIRYSTTNEVASNFSGIAAGAQVNFPTSRLFALKGGLQYRFSFTNGTVAYYNLQKGDASICEHSLEVPVTFGIRFPIGKAGRNFMIDLGPTGSFNMYSSMKPSTNVMGYSTTERYNLHKAGLAQRWNLFGCLTLGYAFTDFLTFKAGYRYGFLNQGSETNTIKINSITASIAVNL